MRQNGQRCGRTGCSVAVRLCVALWSTHGGVVGAHMWSKVDCDPPSGSEHRSEEMRVALREMPVGQVTLTTGFLNCTFFIR